jgi:hypothetical protein
MKHTTATYHDHTTGRDLFIVLTPDGFNATGDGFETEAEAQEIAQQLDECEGDLFCTPPGALPQNVLSIINDWDDDADPLKECEHINARLLPLGFTFDWGLAGEPFNLRRIN